MDRAVRAALTLLPWLAGTWLFLVLLSRLLNLFPDPVRLHALWLVPLLAAAAALALHRRPTNPDAARKTDQALGTRDLFLTVSRLDASPGGFKGIVESQAAEAAAAGKPAVIAPYAWERPAGIAAGSLAALALAVLLLPQLDPFKKGEERAKNDQQKKELAALKKNTDEKKKELAKKPREEVSKNTKDSLDRLRQSFQQMKPKQKEKNDEKLKEEQRDIGKQWQKQSEDLLKKSPLPRVARLRHLCGHLPPRQMPALPRFRPLPDFDLQQVGRVDQVDVHPKPPRGDLLTPVVRVLPQHVGNFATLPVDREHVEPVRPLGIRPERDFTLRPERHRGDHEWERMSGDAGVNFRWINRLITCLNIILSLRGGL